MNREAQIAELLVNEKLVAAARKCFDGMVLVVHRAFKELLNREPPALPEVDVRVREEGLPEGKVGRYQMPNDEHESGILTIHPGAFTGEKAPYWHVIAHETIHAFLGPDSESHGREFDMLAGELEIPVKYRD